MDWFKTPKRHNNGVADIRTWYTKCRRYKVEESKIPGLPTRYRAMKARDDGGWEILSTHRKRETAQAQIEYFDEHGRIQVKPVKPRRKKKKR